MTRTAITDVLVVGAGPTGLTLAADLLRRGLAVRIVDAAPAPSPDSRATSLTPRTLEVLDDLGVAQALLDTGVRITETEAYEGDTRTFRIRFPDTDETRFPFLLNNSQRETERVLADLVEHLGGRVERDRRLTGFRQERDAVVARVTGAGGDEEIRASWLVGADGGRSTVRRTLGVPFRGPGDTLEETIVLGDVLLDRDLPADRLLSWFNADGALLAFPFTEPGRWRVTAALSPAELADGRYTRPTLDALTALYRRRTGDTTTGLRDLRGFSVYRVNQRVADHVRRGRVLLAGDAAHVHTPAGGLGMNTGIQDAYALGWRLAAALRTTGDPEAADRVVDGYERERLPVARALLRSTGGLQRLYSIRDRRLQRARDVALDTVLGLGPVRRAFFRRAAQLDVGYRTDRPLRGVAAGDRAPDGPAHRPGHGPTRLYDHLRGTGPVLVVLAGDGDTGPGLGATGTVCARAAAAGLRTVLVRRQAVDPDTAAATTTLLDRGGVLHRRYAARRTTLVLVRPDGHVAATGRAADVDALIAAAAPIGPAPAATPAVDPTATPAPAPA